MTEEEAKKIAENHIKLLTSIIGYSDEFITPDGKGLLLLKYLYDALSIYFGKQDTSDLVSSASTKETEKDNGHAMNTHLYPLLFG